MRPSALFRKKLFTKLMILWGFLLSKLVFRIFHNFLSCEAAEFLTGLVIFKALNAISGFRDPNKILIQPRDFNDSNMSLSLSTKYQGKLKFDDPTLRFFSTAYKLPAFISAVISIGMPLLTADIFCISFSVENTDFSN